MTDLQKLETEVESLRRQLKLMEELHELKGRIRDLEQKLAPALPVLPWEGPGTVPAWPFGTTITNVGLRCIGSCDYSNTWYSTSPPTCRRCGIAAAATSGATFHVPIQGSSCTSAAVGATPTSISNNHFGAVRVGH